MREIEFPDKLQFLFRPARYKCAYGGRGAAKSWGFAKALLTLGYARPLRILCAREFQNSIEDSVHKLLGDQVKAMGLESFYEVQQRTIRGANGTSFAFEGLRHNINSLKSFEGADIAWVEEAQTVSRASWNTLVPTIRKEGSEIWVSFNPELEEDETYQRFVVREPPTGAVVVKMNSSDNPWLTGVLAQERADLRQRDFQAYLNVWEGHCRQTLDGAIYAKEIVQATEEGRICKVPYDASLGGVRTFWDLGWSDMVSIWLAQKAGFEYRFIDFIQGRHLPIEQYVKQLQEKAYVYDTDYLPHDAQAKTLAAAGKSIEEQMKALGRKVVIVPRASVTNGINAVRSVFPNCYFDQEKCADGLQSLRRYCYDVDTVTGQFSREPKHDDASHGADAFRMFAMGRQEKPQTKRPQVVRPQPAVGSWMGH